MNHQFLGRRLRALREARGMSQEDMRVIFGFKDRQTVSAIETDTRRLTAQELMTVIDEFGVSLEYFNDPFQLIGEGEFSWRVKNVSEERLQECEQKARRWIAAYRVLAPQFGHKSSFIRHSLGITKLSTFTDAMTAGEQFVEEFDLGDVPASRLIEVMEEKLNILVLMVNACEGVSNVTCRLPDLTTVLIARGETEGQRYLNLAHQLFHILTWDAIPPSHIEESRGLGKSKAERLADSFTSALLMPASTLNGYGNWSRLNERELISQLHAVSKELHVSSTALSWRLVALGQISRSVVQNLSRGELHKNELKRSVQAQPTLFSKKFARVVGRAVEVGNISARRTASVLDMNLEDLNGLFLDHDLDFRVQL